MEIIRIFGSNIQEFVARYDHDHSNLGCTVKNGHGNWKDPPTPLQKISIKSRVFL